ncbi:MAG: hypothetical protein ACP5ID_00385, partial [Conexivisphaera sp.]
MSPTLTDAVLIEVEHPEGLRAAIDWARGALCEERLVLDGRRAVLRCANAVRAVNMLAWAPGVSLASYGEFVGPGTFRELAQDLVRLAARDIAGDDRVWFHVEGDGSLEFQDYLAGELVSSTGAVLDGRRPEKLFTVILAGGGAFLSHGYRRGIGGLPLGSEGSAIVLFSGGRCSAEAFVEALRAGFSPSPLFLEMGGATPPGEVRRALAAAATIVSNSMPQGGTVLVGYVPRGTVAVLREGGGRLLHRFLAEV